MRPLFVVAAIAATRLTGCVFTASCTKQMGEVKRFEVGILFFHIHEDDQEAIIKHVLTRQRNILRNKVKS
jgi:hypothetical protein